MCYFQESASSGSSRLFRTKAPMPEHEEYRKSGQYKLPYPHTQNAALQPPSRRWLLGPEAPPHSRSQYDVELVTGR